MKLSDWARQQGVHPKTALRWYQGGVLPVPARKVGPRTILVEAASGWDGDQAVALYARVSSHDQKADLERQVGRLTERDTSVRPVGSGSPTWRPVASLGP